MAKSKKSDNKLSEQVLFLHALYNVDPCYRSVIIKHFDKRSRNLVLRVFKNVIQDKTKMDDKCKKHVKECLSPYKDKLRSLIKAQLPKADQLSRVGGKPMDVVLSAAIPDILDKCKHTHAKK